MWFCTESGLSRFDGYGFTNYTEEQGLPNNEVNDLLETRDGAYWLATANGLCRFNPKGSPLKQHESLPGDEPMFVSYRPGRDRQSSNVKALYQDRAGTIWCGTWTGLYKVVPLGKGIEFQPVDLVKPTGAPTKLLVRNILEDRRNSLWVATNNGLFRRFPDGRIEHFTIRHGFASNLLMGLVEDRHGRLWAGDRLGGLYQLVSEPEESRRIVERNYSIKDGLSCNPITSLFESRDGQLLIGTDCGMNQLAPGDEKDTRRVRQVLSSDVLTNPRAWCMAEDRQGNLWIGTPYGAVRITRNRFTSYTEADGVGARQITFIFESKSGDLFVQSRNSVRGFVSRFDGHRFVTTNLKLPNLSDPSRWKLREDREGRWWLSATDGVWRFPENRSFDEIAKLRPNLLHAAGRTARERSAYSAFEDGRGDIWISAEGEGLIRWEKTTGVFHTFSRELPDNLGFVTDQVEDRAGNMWLAFSNGPLFQFANGAFRRFTAYDDLQVGTVRRILIDARGTLWLATSTGGLGRIDDPAAERPSFRAYTTGEGLSSNDVYSIAADALGRIYAGTTQGLDRLDPATGRVKRFTKADGLSDNLVSVSFRDRHGTLWFGTDTGLSRLSPETDQVHLPQPVFISSLQIPGLDYRVSEIGETNVGELTLSEHQNDLQITLLGLSSADADGLLYQYKLEGSNDDWSRLTNQRTVNYVNLAPGRYRFLARAVNANGDASETPASISFAIQSPVWKRWWFVTLVAFLIAAIAYAVHRYRMNELLKMERLRMQIAADLHDDIGSSLSQISIISEVVLARMSGNDPALVKSLSSIAESSRELVDSMKDIVWAINPRRDNLRDLVHRMRRFATETLTAQDLNFDFIAPDQLPEANLDTNTRREIFLAFKETVNNSVRHSNCTAISMKLCVEDGVFHLDVEDDGSGFDPVEANQGHGLFSLRQRAERIGGTFEVFASKGHGTRVSLIAPLKPLRRRFP